MPREVIAESDTTPVTVAVYNDGASPVRLDFVSSGGVQAVVRGPMQTIAPDSAARVAIAYQGVL